MGMLVLYHDEGLVLQGGGRLMHPRALLQVLLQSQSVDGEEGHVWLMDTKTDAWGRKQTNPEDYRELERG